MPRLFSWWASVAWPAAATPVKTSVFLRTVVIRRAYRAPQRLHHPLMYVEAKSPSWRRYFPTVKAALHTACLSAS